MNSMKKQLCLIFVCNALLVNHIVAMDEDSSSSSSPKHRRSPSLDSRVANFIITTDGSSSSSRSPKVIITDGSPKGKSPTASPTSSPFRLPKSASSTGNLNDIDGDVPSSSSKPSKQKGSSSPIINLNPSISQEAFLDRENHFHNARLGINIIVPTASANHHDAAWSAALTSPNAWMPVITGATQGIVQALLVEAALWLKKDPVLAGLEKQILLAKYTNTEKELEIEKSELEIKQKELEIRKESVKSFAKNVAAIQANIDKLMEKMNNGEELSAPEDKALEKSLAFMQRLATAA